MLDNVGQSMSINNEPNPELKFQKPGINRVISGNDRAIPGNDRAINYYLKV
jgi:hypothetical protein